MTVYNNYLVVPKRLGSYDSEEDNNILFNFDWAATVVSVFNVHLIVYNIKQSSSWYLLHVMSYYTCNVVQYRKQQKTVSFIKSMLHQRNKNASDDYNWNPL